MTEKVKTWGKCSQACSKKKLGAEMEADLAGCIKGMQHHGFPVDCHAILLKGDEIY